jgi:hypothetical protein
MNYTVTVSLTGDLEDQEIDSLDFTRRSEERFYDSVDLSDFKDADADIIFQHLRGSMRYIPFGDYLKRYIYDKAQMSGDYKDIELKEYQQIIIHSFKENSVRQDILETSAKISTLANNWLTQLSVSRNAVFWLGFGLNMSMEDVSLFLKKALREQDINIKNPTETIYWYCLKNGYKFPKAIQLKELYDGLPSVFDGDAVLSDKTSSIRSIFANISDDESLMRYLSKLKTIHSECAYSVTAQNLFENLYRQCQRLVASYNNRHEQDDLDIAIERYKDKARRSDVLTITDIENHTQALRGRKKIWTESDIGENDIEKMLCCGMPRKRDGHLHKLSMSTLSKLFCNKRLTGERMKSILQKKTAVDRFDLITLNFLLYAEDERYENNKSRYTAFLESANDILSECSMEELYIANPYECFLLMCILSDGPLATYTDVWEKSFSEM